MFKVSDDALLDLVDLLDLTVSELLVVRDEIVHLLVFLVDDLIFLLLSFTVCAALHLRVDFSHFFFVVVYVTLDLLCSFFRLSDQCIVLNHTVLQLVTRFREAQV